MEQKKCAMISFTAAGAELCARLLAALPDKPDWEAYAPSRYSHEPVMPLEDTLARWTEKHFDKCEAIVFVGAVGIAVRAIAPHIVRKDSDPAVICIDEQGRHVIPLLSGHIGGANALADRLAGLIDGRAVITTATDLNGRFAVDVWAVKNACAIADISQIKHISAALLDGKTVGIHSDYPVTGKLPEGIVQTDAAESGILISLKDSQPYRHTLHLVPRCLRLGVGCRKGIDFDVLERRILTTLEHAGLPLTAVSSVASIDIKAGEPALVRFCEQYSLPFTTYTADQLRGVEGEFVSSAFVEGVTGVDNVCERSAMVDGGHLVVGKTTGDGVSVAVAMQDWSATF